MPNKEIFEIFEKMADEYIQPYLIRPDCAHSPCYHDVLCAFINGGKAAFDLLHSTETSDKPEEP